MKANIVMSFRPFEGEHAILQDLSLHSWLRQRGCRIIVIDGGEVGVRERCDKLGLQTVTGVQIGTENGHKTTRFMAKSFWEEATKAIDRDCEYVAYVNADIVAMNKGFLPLLEHCTYNEGDVWGAFWRRINIVNWRHFIADKDYDTTIENVREELWYHGSVNYPGMGDVTCWTYKGFEKFMTFQPDVPWDLLGMDRVWLDMHFKCGYVLFEHTFAFPIAHPYHVFSTKQVPDEVYEKVFKRKVWPELWEGKFQNITAFDSGLLLVDWRQKSAESKQEEVPKVGGKVDGN